jgi:chloride channel protein, CIC family
MDEPEKAGLLSRWRRQIESWVRSPQREDQVFLVLTLVIGALVGLAVVGFILVTERLGARLYPPGGAAWRRLLVPALGALLTGWLLYRYFPDARGSGIPQTKAALFAREGRITLPTVLGKFGCTAGALASGIPLGREGPSVQVGAGIASVLGRRLGMSTERVKALVPVGGAAGVAAAFNTPLAGVLFALEELMGNLHAPMLGSVVLGAATAWMVLRLSLGDEPLFSVPAYHLVHPVEFLLYALLGILGGLLSAAFVKGLLRLRARFLRMPERTRWLQPVAGGLVVGVMGWFVPEVLGVGYNYVGQALNGQMLLQTMALLLLLKSVAVIASYSSGNAGGIFGPSLFLGAMLGGALGSAANWLLPDLTASPGAYALVGMGAAFAGIVRAPFTSVIMIFELTREYTIIVPLMLANVISYLISLRLQPKPIYEALALQDGIHLPTSQTRDRQGGFPVRAAMRPAAELFNFAWTVEQALQRAHGSEFHAWPVVGERGLVGVISLAQLERARAEGAARRLEEVVDREAFPHVHADQSLDLALERMGRGGLDALPVVNRANIRELEGIIALRDVMATYGLARQAWPAPEDPEPRG